MKCECTKQNDQGRGAGYNAPRNAQHEEAFQRDARVSCNAAIWKNVRSRVIMIVDLSLVDMAVMRCVQALLRF